MRTCVQRGLRWGLLSLLAGLGLLFVDGPATQARAADPSQMAAVLRSRIWWENLGSFGSQTWGYIYIFGPQAAPGQPGWYTGTRVTYQGSYGTRQYGFAWSPRTNGVVIDHAFAREEITFTTFNQTYEVLSFRAVGGSLTRPSAWSSTRSSLTPAAVRNLGF